MEVVDDYAHHPMEIEATLAAARGAYPDRRIVAAFQPHLFSRTRDLAREFGEALAQADVVYLLDVYPSREQPIPGVTSALIADVMTALGRPPVWRGTRDAHVPALRPAVRPGDLVITMGAGDVTRCAAELLAASSSARA